MPPLTFEAAYWKSFDLVFGEEGGRILRAMLLAKAETRGRKTGRAWETVHRELEEILSEQARAILALAERIQAGQGQDSGTSENAESWNH